MFYLMGYDNSSKKYEELSRRNSFRMIKEDYFDTPMNLYTWLEIWNETEKNSKYHCNGEYK